MKTPIKATLALAVSLALFGCASHPVAPGTRTDTNEVHGHAISRQVALMPYQAQGVTVAGTTTWYYGQTPGLSAYKTYGGIVYVEARPNERLSSLPRQEEDRAESKGASAQAKRLQADRTRFSYCSPVVLDADSALVGRYSFHFASATDLYADAQRALALLLDGSAPARALHVVGYTDDIGTDEVNLPLSKARAETVAQLIRAAWPDVRVTTEGRGGCPRLVPNTGSENRAKNRRVEIFMLEDD